MFHVKQMEVLTMASYTMQLREYIEQATQDTEEMSWDARIEAGRTKLFDFTYPIFDSNYKKVFETHFINNFYTREIGFETEGLFKFKLKNWLNINMPYFNKLFQSELIDFDPLVNSITEITKKNTKDRKQNLVANTNGTSNGSSTQSASGTASEDDFSRNLESDNPDSRLTITTNDGEGVIEYASKIDEHNANNSKSSSTSGNASSSDSSNVDSTSDTTINETEDYLQFIMGKTGNDTFSKMLNEYRSTFLRIERDIFKEMNKELFMLIY